MRTGIGNSHCRFHLGSTMSWRFPICHREVTTFPTSQNNSRAKFYAAGDLRVTSDIGTKGQTGKISPTALSYWPRAWSSAIDQGIDPVQPKEQTKAQRRAISRMLQKPPGLPQLVSKSNAGRRAERYRQPQETERLRTRSLQPGNGTTDRARDWNIVIGENKVKIKLVVLCHNNTQGSVFAPPHPPFIQAFAAEAYWRQDIAPALQSPSFSSCSRSHTGI